MNKQIRVVLGICFLGIASAVFSGSTSLPPMVTTDGDIAKLVSLAPQSYQQGKDELSFYIDLKTAFGTDKKIGAALAQKIYDALSATPPKDIESEIRNFLNPQAGTLYTLSEGTPYNYSLKIQDKYVGVVGGNLKANDVTNDVAMALVVFIQPNQPGLMSLRQGARSFKSFNVVSELNNNHMMVAESVRLGGISIISDTNGLNIFAQENMNFEHVGAASAETYRFFIKYDNQSHRTYLKQEDDGSFWWFSAAATGERVIPVSASNAAVFTFEPK